MALPVGTKAPDFTLRTMTEAGISNFTLSDNIGNSGTLLLFVPGAFTEPCTNELCDVTAGLGAYANLGISVFAISCDSVFSQYAWASQKSIGVQLLADYMHKVTELYDVVLPDLAGMGPASKRAAFVLDKDGIIVYSAETATPSDMPDFAAIQEAVEALTG